MRKKHKLKGQIIVCRVRGCSNNKDQLSQSLKHCKSVSLALDESCDMRHHRINTFCIVCFKGLTDLQRTVNTWPK